MRNLASVLVFIVGVLLALYLGVWVMFVGGIIQLVEAIKTTPVEAFGIAIGAVRILGASFVGYFTFLVSTFVARIIAES